MGSPAEVEEVLGGEERATKKETSLWETGAPAGEEENAQICSDAVLSQKDVC